MRIFLPPELIAAKNGISLPQDKAHHLVSVIRAKTGDEVTIIDGKGKTYLAAISDIKKKAVFVNIIREIKSQPESSIRLMLCQGILKGEKMDLVIQKATELGVSEIVPLISERCQVRHTRKTDRWRKIAEEAAEQCGRAVIPAVCEPVKYADFIGRLPDGGLIFWEGGGIRPDIALSRLRSSGKCIRMCVGPEGGFSLPEVEAAEEAGFIRTTLGNSILRAETASIAGAALIRFLAEKPTE
jgi:16S rRNA (uracil1498-N3)-methyltransferase